jgi:hypothetical protein
VLWSAKPTTSFGKKTNWLWMSMGGLTGLTFGGSALSQPMSWILGIRRKGRNMTITRKQIAEAYERLDILTAQIGNATIRKMHKDPLKQFIKAVEKEMDEKNKTAETT